MQTLQVTFGFIVFALGLWQIMAWPKPNHEKSQIRERNRRHNIYEGKQ